MLKTLILSSRQYKMRRKNLHWRTMKVQK